jgi:hypothetical protein
MPTGKNELGKRYGKWLVLEQAPADKNKCERFWKCRCDCGTEKYVSGSDLRGGGSTGCCYCAPNAKGSNSSLASRMEGKFSGPDENGCINWTGATATKHKYGVTSEGSQHRTVYVHRVVWEAVNGPIPITPPPDGSSEWQIHHLCFNRLCGNIDHLQLVTEKEHHRIHKLTSPKFPLRWVPSPAILTESTLLWHRYGEVGRHLRWAWSAEL